MADLAPRLEASSAPLGPLALSDARLQLDARWPWIVLIPRAGGLCEIEDLHPLNRARLADEIVLAGKAVRAVGEALGRPVEKLNVGALGNIVPQLHVHVLGRRADDAAWPGPVWGFGAAHAYGQGELETALAAAKRALGLI